MKEGGKKQGITQTKKRTNITLGEKPHRGLTVDKTGGKGEESTFLKTLKKRRGMAEFCEVQTSLKEGGGGDTGGTHDRRKGKKKKGGVR